MIDVRIRIIAHNMQSNYVTWLSNEINPGISKLLAVVGHLFWTEYLMSYIRIIDLQSWRFHTRKLQYLHFFNQSGDQ